MLDKQYYVYFLTNRSNEILYVGVTNNLQRRIYEHQNKSADGFTKKYNLCKLVYYEVWENIEGAILREKQIKAKPRRKKDELVKEFNPKWQDLSDKIQN
jgi:putative endonuclease